ncbi:MAG TPA: DUF2085 domain-containing protein [Anaerolineae bacterium]|nr:DUF2085 domain-containing protein [Anaerolineae bacterium]
MHDKGTSNTTNQIWCWLSKNYLTIIIIVLLLYLSGAFLAPVFMEIGWDYVAYPIYYFYSHCHQLAFRSWFLFGERAFYPRSLANIQGVINYEEIIRNENLDLEMARKFLGDKTLGFKVALCQRDVAIYSSLLLAAIMFWLSGRRIKPIPWYFWVLIGITPIALDGITQLGGLDIDFLAWLPTRESTPLLRTFTGGLFGSMTGFYLYPLLEESMQISQKHNFKEK